MTQLDTNDSRLDLRCNWSADNKITCMKSKSYKSFLLFCTVSLNGFVVLDQGWPNVAHCMVGGGAFDVLGNLRKCVYRCPEKFVIDY